MLHRPNKVCAGNAADDLTESDDEMRVAMRQIVGVFSQLEKTRLVKKLRAARERTAPQIPSGGLRDLEVRRADPEGRLVA